MITRLPREPRADPNEPGDGRVLSTAARRRSQGRSRLAGPAAVRKAVAGVLVDDHTRTRSSAGKYLVTTRCLGGRSGIASPSDQRTTSGRTCDLGDRGSLPKG